MGASTPFTTDDLNFAHYLSVCWNIPIASPLVNLEDGVYNITLASQAQFNGTPIALPIQAISELNELSGTFPAQIAGFAVFAILFGEHTPNAKLTPWLITYTRGFLTWQLSFPALSVSKMEKSRITPDRLGIHNHPNTSQCLCLRGENSCHSGELEKRGSLSCERVYTPTSRLSSHSGVLLLGRFFPPYAEPHQRGILYLCDPCISLDI
jgi:hypothetical protein